MAEQSQHRISRPAAADLSTKQYYFVKSSNGKAALPSADGGMVLGVLQNDPLADEGSTICDGGRTQVVSNGTVEIDKPVAAANGGKAKEAASGEYVQGIALTGDGGVDGAIIEIHYNPQGRLA